MPYDQMHVGGPYGDRSTAVSIAREAAKINHLPMRLFVIRKRPDGYHVYRQFGGFRYG